MNLISVSLFFSIPSQELSCFAFLGEEKNHKLFLYIISIDPFEQRKQEGNQGEFNQI